MHHTATATWERSTSLPGYMLGGKKTPPAPSERLGPRSSLHTLLSLLGHLACSHSLGTFLVTYLVLPLWWATLLTTGGVPDFQITGTL